VSDYLDFLNQAGSCDGRITQIENLLKSYNIKYFIKDEILYFSCYCRNINLKINVVVNYKEYFIEMYTDKDNWYNEYLTFQKLLDCIRNIVS